jgi:SNF2 family DNA or RNA helicase
MNSNDGLFTEVCLGRLAELRGQSEAVYSTQGVMESLENLHHESELTCEGLSVELLAFQKQSLKWALERETISGGVQSCFWIKVPVSILKPMQKIIDLYYSPILDRFSKKKAREVCGGIIAAEMGLGKTLISLAPQLPISGSNIDDLTIAPGANVENPSKWDKDLYAQSSAANPKRGSILSRGTLVICPKSLVGQWIEGM